MAVAVPTLFSTGMIFAAPLAPAAAVDAPPRKLFAADAPPLSHCHKFERKPPELPLPPRSILVFPEPCCGHRVVHICINSCAVLLRQMAVCFVRDPFVQGHAAHIVLHLLRGQPVFCVEKRHVPLAFPFRQREQRVLQRQRCGLPADEFLPVSIPVFFTGYLDGQHLVTLPVIALSVCCAATSPFGRGYGVTVRLVF